ncbi:hypothetical protein M9980_01635 [Sphingomonas donggukensis]|uniref:Glycerophosphoryl diester phosphodiesterase membrane domain-containing protein n=1 Tax=Sphingomonas donggukensis TaxID=2949093 RepID=A0ABY4TU70_9SPHN|nr:hypothetical protein [Sphingomonas donggukensis]URW75960.1 hypothetical protein M9980_01635 [Sphingomonas donggukensis]
MKLPFTTAFGDAWAAWRRDTALLLPLAGLTMFLPQLAVLLLVPPLPPMATPEDGQMTEAAAQAWADAFTLWAGQHGIWYALAPAVGLFGALAVMALYLDRQRPTLGGALARGAMLFLRYLLASILIAIAAIGILMPGAASRLLLAAMIAPAFYILGRTMLAGPVIVAQAPVGAVAAIRRSWALTRGHGWMLAATYAAILMGAQLVGGVFLSLAAMGTGSAGANPVVATVFDGAAAVVTSAAALTLALVQVALYRRLASKGT